MNPLFHCPVQWEKPLFPWLGFLLFILSVQDQMQAGYIAACETAACWCLIPPSLSDSSCPPLWGGTGLVSAPHSCPAGPTQPGWIGGMKACFVYIKCILLTHSPASSSLPLHFSSMLWCGFDLSVLLLPYSLEYVKIRAKVREIWQMWLSGNVKSLCPRARQNSPGKLIFSRLHMT